MKKALSVLLVLVLLLMPKYAMAKEGYNTSYKITEDDYYIEFEVKQKDLYLNNFYAGQKLNDYIIDGYCTYKGYWFDYVVWENPDYVIQEGTQEIIIGLKKNKGITFSITMEGVVLQNESKPTQKRKLISEWVDNPNGRGVSVLQYSDFSELPGIPIYDAETGMPVSGKIIYPNLDNSRLGTYDLEWLFIPDDPTYEELSGTIRVEVRVPEEPDEPTTPSLTATKIMLDSMTSYDINLNNKILGSKYKWTSSNPKVAKVNEKNGFVTAVSEGTAIITCEITLPNGTTQILQSLVTVGYDENAPVLTDTQLDLEIGDKYDINVENKIAKSKYRWVSSDRNVVKVNSSNGKVTAVGPGVAYIACTITTPENQVIVLRCDVTVTEPEE